MIVRHFEGGAMEKMLVWVTAEFEGFSRN